MTDNQLLSFFRLLVRNQQKMRVEVMDRIFLLDIRTYPRRVVWSDILWGDALTRSGSMSGSRLITMVVIKTTGWNLVLRLAKNINGELEVVNSRIFGDRNKLSHDMVLLKLAS